MNNNTIINKKAILACLWGLVDQAGSQRALAKKLNLGLSNINGVLTGHREPPKSLLNKIGWRKVVTFEPDNENIE